MSYSYFSFFLNIIEDNTITVWKFVVYSSKIFPQLLTEASRKILACWVPNESLKKFFSGQILDMEGMGAMFD